MYMFVSTYKAISSVTSPARAGDITYASADEEVAFVDVDYNALKLEILIAWYIGHAKQKREREKSR